MRVILHTLAETDPTDDGQLPKIAVLRALGGYSAIISREIEQHIAQLSGNPRAAPDALILNNRLQEELPRIRERVQMLVSRIPSVALTTPTRDVSRSRHASCGRTPLRVGAHSETELISDQVRFGGRPDLLIITESDVAIIDFKSGAVSERHEDQLRIYSLLWHLDAVANPKKLPVKSLTVSYVGDDVHVDPPEDIELAELTMLLNDRIEAADTAVGARPPRAIPSEHCRWCPVRHLCDEYWKSEHLNSPAESTYGDIEATVLKRNGPLSWEIELAKGGPRLLLRTASESPNFVAGDKVRFLDVFAVEENDCKQVLLFLTGRSESFVLE